MYNNCFSNICFWLYLYAADEDRQESIELSDFVQHNNSSYPGYDMQRRNSDPTIESPNEYSHQRPLMRKYSNDPCAPTPNPDDPYFPTVPPHAIATPTPESHSNIRDRYNSNLGGNYGDYRENYSQNYRDTFNRRNYYGPQDDYRYYRDGFRENYCQKPLDYREDYRHDYSSRNYNFDEFNRSDYNRPRLPEYNDRYKSNYYNKSEYYNRLNDFRGLYREDAGPRRYNYRDDYRDDYLERNKSYRDGYRGDYRSDNYDNYNYRNEYRKDNFRGDMYSRNEVYNRDYDRDYVARQSSNYTREEYTSNYNKGNYDYNRDEYTQDYSQRSYDQPRRRYRDTNPREVNNYNEDTSVSDAHYSESYMSSKKINDVSEVLATFEYYIFIYKLLFYNYAKERLKKTELNNIYLDTLYKIT